MKCPVCGTKNRPGIIICLNCDSDLYSALLEQITTKPLDRNRERKLDLSQMMPSSNPLVLYIRNAPEPLALPRSGQVTLGRIEEHDEEHQPDIDLEAYSANDLGVSRQHLELDTEADPPTVTDLDSFNGTFINGQRLTPHHAYPVQCSDEIRLGRLVMRLFYDT